ncbi:MAG TPA: hypothetical protein VNT03_07215 [Baekduia sp.]|nr:hypothetical protein [Baekduia sp.]
MSKVVVRRIRRGAGLLFADYRALYARKRPGVHEATGKAAALAVPRIVMDANLHALVLVRAVGAAPPPLRGMAQRLLLAGHGMYVDPRAEIGPGLFMPHPLMIAVGPGVTIGAGVSVFHNATVRAALAEREGPHVQDGVRIYTGAALVGALTVGAGAVVGAGTTVSTDVPPAGRVVRRHGGPDGGDAALGPGGDAAGATDRRRPRVSLTTQLRGDHAMRFGAERQAAAWRLLRDAALDRPFRVATVARLQAAGPRPLWRLWRRVLLTQGCDIGRDASIGPGLGVPCPLGVVVGRRAVLGAGVELFEHTTVTPTKMVWEDAPAGRGLEVGDRVRVLPGAGAFGDLTIAPQTAVAPRALVTRDVAGGRTSEQPARRARRRDTPTLGLLALIRSDLHRAPGGGRVRTALGVSFQAAVLVRLATSRRRLLARVGAAALRTLHHCDVDAHVLIGPGLLLPLPCGIRIEAGVNVGAAVTIYDRVSLRSDRCLDGLGAAPRIADGAVLGSGAVVIGHGTVAGEIADGAVVAPRRPRDIAAPFSNGSRSGHRRGRTPG